MSGSTWDFPVRGSGHFRVSGRAVHDGGSGRHGSGLDERPSLWPGDLKKVSYAGQFAGERFPNSRLGVANGRGVHSPGNP